MDKKQMIKVRCIYGVKSCYSLIKEDSEYFIDANSLYSDSEGDWTVEVYNLDKAYVGRFYLKHFKSVAEN